MECNKQTNAFDVLYDELLKLIDEDSPRIKSGRCREVEGSLRIATLHSEFQRTTMSKYPGYSVRQACEEYERIATLFASQSKAEAKKDTKNKDGGDEAFLAFANIDISNILFVSPSFVDGYTKWSHAER